MATPKVLTLQLQSRLTPERRFDVLSPTVIIRKMFSSSVKKVGNFKCFRIVEFLLFHKVS